MSEGVYQPNKAPVVVKSFSKEIVFKNSYLRSVLEREIELFHLDRGQSKIDEVNETAAFVHLICKKNTETSSSDFADAFFKSLDSQAYFAAQLEESDSCDSDFEEPESQLEIALRLNKVA